MDTPGEILIDLERRLEIAEADRAARLEVILRQGREIGRLETEIRLWQAEITQVSVRLYQTEEQCRERGYRLSDLEAQFEQCDADRDARLGVILQQGKTAAKLTNERNLLRFQVADLEAHLQASEADRAARLEAINARSAAADLAMSERNVLQFKLADLQGHFAASEADRAARLAAIENQQAEIELLREARDALEAELELARRSRWLLPGKASAPAPPERSSAYQPQFDGLRALAVLAVVADHFTADYPNFPLPGSFHFGPVSVRLFLILSGYFITDFLRRTRDSVETGRVAGRRALGGFYARRVLRVLPPYAVFLAAGLALDLGMMRTYVAWIGTFTVNFLIARDGQWPLMISHLWTLCVQEQFYLLWPLLILFLPRRWIFPAIVGTATAGLLFRVECVAYSAPLVARWVLPFGSLDALAGGAALAWMSAQTRVLATGKPWVKIAAGVAASLALVQAGILRNGDPTRMISVLVEPLEVVAFAWVVARTQVGWGGWIERVLTHRALLYAGRISYGIFVYHVLVGVCFDLWTPASCRWLIESPALRLITLSLVTLAVAAGSWHWLERPVNRWRRHFLSADGPAQGQPALA